MLRSRLARSQLLLVALISAAVSFTLPWHLRRTALRPWGQVPAHPATRLAGARGRIPTARRLSTRSGEAVPSRRGVHMPHGRSAVRREGEVVAGGKNRLTHGADAQRTPSPLRGEGRGEGPRGTLQPLCPLRPLSKLLTRPDRASARCPQRAASHSVAVSARRYAPAADVNQQICGVCRHFGQRSGLGIWFEG